MKIQTTVEVRFQCERCDALYDNPVHAMACEAVPVVASAVSRGERITATEGIGCGERFWVDSVRPARPNDRGPVHGPLVFGIESAPTKRTRTFLPHEFKR